MRTVLAPRVVECARGDASTSKYALAIPLPSLISWSSLQTLYLKLT